MSRSQNLNAFAVGRRLVKLIRRLQCRILGHKWPTMWVRKSDGQRVGVGRCQRCGY